MKMSKREKKVGPYSLLTKVFFPSRFYYPKVADEGCSLKVAVLEI